VVLADRVPDTSLEPVGEHHVLLDGLQLVGVGLHLLDERRVDEEDLVLGVVDDVLEVLVRQPHVAHVDGAVRARRPEVEFQVAVVVERDRRDALALAHAEVVQRVR
jgi:hypothetical protein